MFRTGRLSKKSLLLCGAALLLLQAPAADAKRLHAFEGPSDGLHPVANLIMDGSGNLYGTTEYGGSAPCECGTVFKIAPDGTETIVYSFAGGSGDGSVPRAGVVLDSQDNLYGTTSSGGSGGGPDCGNGGCGTVFKITPGGTETIVHAFQGGTADGYQPLAGLIVTGAGALYGTTSNGGAYGQGTVFQIGPKGHERLLYSFCSNGAPCTDGASPQANLILKNGILYGTTFGGGTSGYGTVFKVTTAGAETVLYSFKGRPDGQWPVAGLVMDKSGNLYGTTEVGGELCPQQENNGCGIVFKIAPDNTETILHTFQGGSDGAVPLAGLTIDGAGNLFGTTDMGGIVDNGLNAGTIFEIPAGRAESILYTHTQMTGYGPQASLLLKNSLLYGTTIGGGLHANHGGYGVVFELKK